MSLPQRRFVALPESPLEGVSRDDWARFVAALEIQPISAVSKSNGLGSYDLRPRRLVELGYAVGLEYRRNDGRQVQACDFVLPWTQKRFLAEPVAQYVALCKSISLYYRAIMQREIQKPDGMTMAGALAILHRGGRGALAGWPKLFDQTQELYDRAKEIF